MYLFVFYISVNNKNKLHTVTQRLCLLSPGTYCNSASACFVASDGKNLRLYQAVVDARKLLDELSDPEASVRMFKSFSKLISFYFT